MKHELKEELTTKMHAELTVSALTDIKHKVFSVLTLINGDLKKAENWVEIYGVTMQDVNHFLNDWKKLQ
jgi:hypothetical protein